MPHPSPLISALLVSWNRREQLAAALDSLLAQDYPGLEIVVADNGSTDGTREMLEERYAGRARVLAMGENRGASRARNAAVRAARGRYLLFMDSDAVLLSADGIARLVERLERSPELAGAAGVIYQDRACRRVWLWGGVVDRWGYIDVARSRAPGHPIDVLCTCFALVRRELVQEVGGFDPFYFYIHEDTDLFLRLARLGRGYAVDPEVRVWHDQRPDGRASTTLFQRARHFEWRRIYLLLKLWGPVGYLRSLPGTLPHYRDLLARLEQPPMPRWQELYLFGVMPFYALWLYPRARWARGRDFLAEA